ncbi:hypothetical protein AVEN_196941-1 [Araneus ventricosus]|uniref:Uncharacterized protein n=1 Tax=Araneus ventricosus TaxID=182803 RepID=A0A4Y2WXL3_ARAVE|nr:hypothetical protein AVEN_196941-1 [Araneus ventricosus]
MYETFALPSNLKTRLRHGNKRQRCEPANQAPTAFNQAVVQGKTKADPTSQLGPTLQSDNGPRKAETHLNSSWSSTLQSAAIQSRRSGKQNLPSTTIFKDLDSSMDII